MKKKLLVFFLTLAFLFPCLGGFEALAAVDEGPTSISPQTGYYTFTFSSTPPQKYTYKGKTYKLVYHTKVNNTYIGYYQ